ncbi:MAG: Rieske 2Fe-2S domain-containing protein [Magnetospirillum sp. WYHS-4]
MGGLSRRGFVRLAAGGLAVGVAGAGAGALAQPGMYPTSQLKPARYFEKVGLVDATGAPLRASALGTGQDHIFHYPFNGTPCLIVDLGEPTGEPVLLSTQGGERYRSVPGLGPTQSIVAYVAICTHLMTHPTRMMSLLNYSHEAKDGGRRGRAISCCAHASVFDAAKGARVTGGEARQPLLSVILEHDAASDGLFATGVLGDEMLMQHFFSVFHRDLNWQYGPRVAEYPVHGTATAVPAVTYSRRRMAC